MFGRSINDKIEIKMLFKFFDYKMLFFGYKLLVLLLVIIFGCCWLLYFGLIFLIYKEINIISILMRK